MPCDTDICQRFLDASEGLVKFVGLAPEESEDAVAFVEAMKDKVNISLAHTNADYAHAKQHSMPEQIMPYISLMRCLHSLTVNRVL